MTWVVHTGDNLDALRQMPDCSVDAVVTDSPYGLGTPPDAMTMLRAWLDDGAMPVKGRGFMGKEWDAFVPQPATWREVYRVLKPGGHLLTFAGTRTQDLMALSLRIAGFEIRDMLGWLYGSGFPKSADVSKHLDAHERKTWLDVAKAIDNADKTAMLTAWKEHSKTASGAGLSFVKSETATGTNMQKSGSAPESVLLQANPESNDAIALVAELSLTVAHRTNGVSCSSVQSPAEKSTTGLRGHATSAESRHASREAILDMLDSSALQNAWGWQDESMVDKLKAVEVLKIWLGRKKSSDAAATSVLCAALTDDLKHIILSQSKTYRDAGTIQQTAFASAITATITESTAESLISFMVDTLRSKAIDKAAGAEREVVGKHPMPGSTKQRTAMGDGWQSAPDITAPATDAARQWNGWGTALKPAIEPITLARKPLDGTVAANVLKWGTGGLNVDGCRVGEESTVTVRTGNSGAHGRYGKDDRVFARENPPGRWPANILHDGSDEVEAVFPDDASRFFYSAKTAAWEREIGLQDAQKRTAAELVGRKEGSAGMANPRAGAGGTSAGRANSHPTVKGVDVMRWLVRLVTPPGGTVLDPYTGSGTTGMACILEGFAFIGCELSAEYADIARARIAATEARQGVRVTDGKLTADDTPAAQMRLL